MPRYRFEELVYNITEKGMPAPGDEKWYIGLEHLDSGSLSVTRWGGDVELTGQKLVMKKGDILFGRRNTYLRRVAIAPHDGYFSAHGMIFRAKEERILSEYLPFLIASDYFMDAAIRISVGSLSPTVNWKTLKELEFEIPEIEEQRKSAALLWAAEDTKRAYEELLKQSDELVKSQFIEIIDKGNYSLVKAGSVMSNLRNGLSPSTSGTHFEKVLTLSAITQGEFDPEACKSGSFDEVPPPDKRISCQDFYICRGNGNKQLVGSGVFSAEDRLDLVFPDTVIAAKVDNTRILLPYLYVAWKQPFVREQIEKGARTTNGTYKINQKIICDVSFPLPPMNVQREFLHTITQLDKSKYLIPAHHVYGRKRR